MMTEQQDHILAFAIIVAIGATTRLIAPPLCLPILD